MRDDPLGFERAGLAGGVYPAASFALPLIYVTAANHNPMVDYLSVLVPIHLTFAWLAVHWPWLGGLLLAASGGSMCVITGLMVDGSSFIDAFAFAAKSVAASKNPCPVVALRATLRLVRVQ